MNTDTQLQAVQQEKKFAVKHKNWYKLRKVGVSKLNYHPVGYSQKAIRRDNLPSWFTFARLSDKEILSVLVNRITTLTREEIAYALHISSNTLYNYIMGEGPFVATRESLEASILTCTLRTEAYQNGVERALVTSFQDILESGRFNLRYSGNKLFPNATVAKAAMAFGPVEKHTWETHNGPFLDFEFNVYSSLQVDTGKTLWTGNKVKTLWLSPGVDIKTLPDRKTLPAVIIDPVEDKTWTVLLS